jgi:sugar/nucleoside kinase (ribokinase family)
VVWRARAQDTMHIEDVTGAGDVFDAGFIAGLAASRLQCETGAVLGVALAATKLRRVGEPDEQSLASVTASARERLRHSLDDVSDIAPDGQLA